MKSRSPSPLGVLLDETRDLSARAGGVVIDRETWRRAVGERIAQRTEPGRLRGGVLTLHVASAAWAQELSFFVPDLLARIAALGVKVTSIRFRVRPNIAHPGARAAAQREAPRAPLPPELEARLAAVSDPALRAAIAEAATLGLGRPALSSEPRARGPRGAAARSAPTARAPATPAAKPPRRPGAR
ncbi:MAG TPA: DUF721 domain-containing protein [Polyangiaceae bacterium]